MASSSSKRPRAADDPAAADPDPSGGDGEDPNVDGERWFAQIDTFIVGYQHYPGELAKNDDIVLVGKAVQNHAGEQCGWLAKEISPLFQAMGNRHNITLEGEVSKKPDKYKVHIRFQIFATGGGNFGGVDEFIRQIGAANPEHGGQTVVQQVGGIAVQALNKDEWKARFPDVVCPKFCRVAAAKKKASSPKNKKIKIEDKLDALYGAEIDYEKMPELSDPFTSPDLNLLPHQKKALWWMVRQEKGDAQRLASVWNKEGNKWRNVITDALHQSPLIPRGGILADEMGLGKTISCLALLRHEGRFVGRQTLVVLPVSTLPAWQEAFQKWLPDFNVVTYHSSAASVGQMSDERTMFRTADVVLTTYETLGNRVANAFWQGAKWHRVILDEAHRIRNRNSKTSAAMLSAFAKTAERKWCLTGTPFVNDMADLFPLIQLLGLHPFDNWWNFNQYLYRVFKVHNNAKGVERLNLLLRPFLLRRMKNQVGLTLPKKNEHVVKLRLTDAQRELYQALHDFCKGEALGRAEEEDDVVLGGAAGASSSFAGGDAAPGTRPQAPIVLQMITRLRQLCLSPQLLSEELLRAVRSKDARKISEVLVKFGTKNLSALQVGSWFWGEIHKSRGTRRWRFSEVRRRGCCSVCGKHVWRILCSAPTSNMRGSGDVALFLTSHAFAHSIIWSQTACGEVPPR